MTTLEEYDQKLNGDFRPSGKLAGVIVRDYVDFYFFNQGNDSIFIMAKEKSGNWNIKNQSCSIYVARVAWKFWVDPKAKGGRLQCVIKN